MGIATKIRETTFSELQLDAGVLIASDRFSPTATDIDAEDILCATTGGITVSCVPTYSDFGADIDNCPNNVKELKHLDGWDCKISTTALTLSVDMLRWSLGAADTVTGTDAQAPKKHVPRKNVNKATDFHDIWWVGDLGVNGIACVKLINALSTSGFSLKTAKNNKGQLSIELTGHVSINDQDTMPMEFYLIGGSGA